MKGIFRFTIVSILLVTLCLVTGLFFATRHSGTTVWPIVQTATAQSAGQGQPLNCSTRVLTGRYAYTTQGTAFNPPPVTQAAAVGVVNFDGGGSLTASDITSVAGTIVPRTITGTYTVDPNCTTTLTLTVVTGFPVGVTFHFSGAIIDRGSEIMLVGTDPGFTFTSTVKRQ